MLYKSVLLLFLFSSHLILAQQNKTRFEKISDDLGIFVDDGISFFAYPIHADWNDVLITSGVAISTYGFMHADKDIRKSIGRKTSKSLNGDFWDVPTSLGIVQYGNIAALSSYGLGVAIDNDDIRVVSRIVFQSLSYSGALVMITRILVGRERPYYEKGPWAYNGFTFDNEKQSFPSGHTTVAFAISSALAEYLDNTYASIFLYSLSGMTAYARVLNNQHWFSDVFVGALMGFIGGYHVNRMEDERNNNSKQSNLHIGISTNQISLRYYFE